MTIKITIPPLAQNLREEILQRRQQIFKAAVLSEQAEIIARTQSGRSIRGNVFEKYSEKWAAFREEKGRNVSPPDLTFSGTMLKSIDSKFETEVDETVKATIFFNQPLEAAKASGNQEKRPFFGLAEEQVKRITEKLRKVTR